MSEQLTVQKRAAVALKSSKAEDELIALVKSSKGITALTNKAARDECHGAAMAARAARTAITKASKSARDDAVQFSKAVIAEEARLVAIIKPEEDRLIAIRDSFDAEQERIKAAKEEAERLRVLEITGRIALFKKAANDAARFDVSADQASEILADLQAIEIDASFAEFFGEAKEEHATSVANIRATVDAKRTAEEAAHKAESDRVEAARVAAEAERIAEQKRQKDVAEAKAKADAEAAERAERERIEAAERKIEHEKADELLRAEAEKLASERKALEELRAKLEAEQAAARAVEEAARKEREAKERSELEAKDSAARAEIDRLEAEKRKAEEVERMADKALFKARAKLIDLAESITDISILSAMFDAARAVANSAAKIKAA